MIGRFENWGKCESWRDSVNVEQYKTCLFRRCYETVWLILHFPFLVIISPPLWSSSPCNSFYCLGHSKNVYDDDEYDRPNHVRTSENMPL